MPDNISTFNTDSSGYRDNRPRYPQDVYTLIQRHCPVRDRAWDCGCGNGQVAIDLTPCFTTIEATDISENQIANAFRHDKIHYTIQPAESTDFPDNHFDLVCAAQCLHWFDLDRFFPEVKRVLKPEGLFACWGYGSFHATPEIDMIIDETLSAKINPYWAPGNRIVQNGYRNIVFPFAEINVPDIPMVIEWDVSRLCAYLDTWSAVKLYNRQHNKDIIASVKPLLERVVPGSMVIRMDFSLYLGRNSIQ